MKEAEEKYIEKHLAFWSMQNRHVPLIGFTVGAGLDTWSYWQYNKAAVALLDRNEIKPEDINPEDFVEDQIRYLRNTSRIDDDIHRSAMPLASIPWMEAVLGCPVFSTDVSMRSREIDCSPEDFIPSCVCAGNGWVDKYLEFIKVYKNALKHEFPVAQSILRGPSDLACAILGAENAAVALLDNPESMHRFLNNLTDSLEQFIMLQLPEIPEFRNGYVVGQYELWAPGRTIRIQEDFSNLFSPEMYDEFLKPLDTRLASLTEYTLIHLHSSSLFLIENFLDAKQIRAFQVTKDPGSTTIDEMIPALLKIQEDNRPLVLKGQFSSDDYSVIRKNLNSAGFCIQPIVEDFEQAEEILSEIRGWFWR